MINTLLKSEKKQNTLSLESLLNDIYLLPKWEKIKEVMIAEKKFLFSSKLVRASIFRKFSAKNNVEKYQLKNDCDKTIGSIDLRVYKDSVYIINMSVESGCDFMAAANILFQIAVEKAIYNTTNKEVIINLSFPLLLRNKIRKLIISEDFETEKEQSNYEKNIFGETFSLKAESSLFWQKKIKQLHILINK